MNDLTTTPEPKAWDQQPQEPDEQYKWFSECFLPLGFRRSIKSAFAEWVIKNNSPKALQLVRGGESRAPVDWIKASQDWNWLERSQAYDAEQVEEALKAVKQAQLNLRLNTVRAVETLIENLSSPRNGVQAAKEILDRGGIPARSVSDVVQTINISSDDMARAAQEVDEWEKKMLGESGSSVKDQ